MQIALAFLVNRCSTPSPSAKNHRLQRIPPRKRPANIELASLIILPAG